MATVNYVRLLVRTWKTILGMMALGMLVAVLVSAIQTWRYGSTVRVLITQTNVVGLDPYTAAKATERIAQNLQEIIYSTSFFNAVMAKGTLDASYFSLMDEIDKRNRWRQSLDISAAAGTGVMTITAYHPTREQATELAVRVAEQLSVVTPNFFGYSVRVQLIDDPLPSRFFAKPDLFKNIIFGLIAGFLLGTAFVLGRVKRSF